MKVPVVNSEGKPLMPTSPARARKMIKSGKATYFWKLGIFCIKLNIKTKEFIQPIVCGVDPGYKREAYTVKSKSATYINIQADSIDWVSLRMEHRRNARRGRRRNCPYRRQRNNRASLKNVGLRPSILARWNWRLSILNKLRSIFPISKLIYEDVKAISKKGNRQWGKSFSNIERGKKYGYEKLRKIADLTLISGKETARLRREFSLIKSTNKLSDSFNAHCVDSWVMAASMVGGVIDNTSLLRITRIKLNRRQLHLFCPKNGVRREQGGTISMGLKRGSIIYHKKYGKCYIGGLSYTSSPRKRISLHSLKDGERICRHARIEDCKFMCYNNSKFFWVA